MINRRTFLTTAAAPFVLRGKAPERHNLLFIAIDDLNNWIGCLGGHPDVKTPNLDRLAARGVLFSNAHCAAPLCNPSRAALMTGIRPSTSGIYDNQQPFRKSPALAKAVTLPQHFMAAGYRVTGGGKIYHGAYPDAASWQSYYPSQVQNKPPDPLPPGIPLSGIPGGAHFDWGPVNVPDSRMGDSQVADWATAELQKKQDRPFFLACGIFRPHLPWYVPPKYFDMYPLDKVTLPNVKEDDLDDVPAMGRKFAKANGDHAKVIKYGQWRQAVRSYLACISFADACVGRVIDALDAGPHAKNTTVVLWSDHGWHLGQKLHWRKFALWEEATHNVFMVTSPGLTKAGGRCARPVNLLDIYPTLIDVFGLPGRKELEGTSLMPLLRDPGARWDRPAVTTYLRGNHSVRSEDWRYIRYSDGGEELYDRRKDPLEWTNLASRAEFEGVKKDLARWMPRTDAPDSVHERGVDEVD
ncbi:MAG: sulfatase [Bryobacteraceae bacterium]